MDVGGGMCYLYVYKNYKGKSEYRENAQFITFLFCFSCFVLFCSLLCGICGDIDVDTGALSVV